ncbi:hypothetical protein OU415_20130 [Saccharopolyspora sp. WRP15-2]|uniref:Uncharacterized protein n=1 Tax=Saccharopolyspora oryzae TaxID=2997343 RepID=A0ABT4V1C6_9PSEU|nr:hypothetical protein [Saccharopolyspora oryzae]MDA3627757.1 hypothetical protein [Saccharopolyspora oryzae]
MVVDRYVLQRVRLYALNNPKRYAALSCSIGGLLVGLISALAPGGRVELPWFVLALHVVIVGSLWAGVMAVFLVKLFRRMGPLPPDTDLVRMRAAQQLVNKGVLGADPATNALAAQLAEQALSVARRKKLATVVFSVLAVLSAFLVVQEIRNGNAGAAVFYGAGALFFLLMLTAGQAWADRRYRNAAQLRQAMTRAPAAGQGDECPPNPA